MSKISLVGGFTSAEGVMPQSVELSNVPLKGANLPEDGIVLFYGFRDSIESCAAWIKDSERKGLSCTLVEVKVEVGDSNCNKTINNLEGSKFLNFKRMDLDVENLVISKWKNYVKDALEDGSMMSAPPEDYYRNKRYLMSNPEFISKLKNEPEFSSNDVFIFPSKNEKNMVIYNAALFSDKNVLSIEVQNPRYSAVEVRLPALGHQRKPKML